MLNLFFAAAVIFCTTFSGTLGQAADATFTNVTESDLESLSKEFSGHFAHSSVSGAKSLGAIFGFDVGLIANTTSTPEMDKIAKRSGGSGIDNLYGGGLLGIVSVPLGFTGELMIFPKTSAAGASLESNSMAIKWTFTDVLTSLPVHMAVRGFSTTSKFGFEQDISGVNSTVENKNTVTGVQLLVSPPLPIVEPYAGVGMLTGKNELSVTGSGTIFDTSYTSSQSADKSTSSTQLILGVNAKLLLFSVGAEYTQAFGTSKYAAKLGFAF